MPTFFIAIYTAAECWLFHLLQRVWCHWHLYPGLAVQSLNFPYLSYHGLFIQPLDFSYVCCVSRSISHIKPNARPGRSPECWFYWISGNIVTNNRPTITLIITQNHSDAEHSHERHLGKHIPIFDIVPGLTRAQPGMYIAVFYYRLLVWPCVSWELFTGHCLTRYQPVNLLSLVIFAAYLVNRHLNSHIRITDISGLDYENLTTLWETAVTKTSDTEMKARMHGDNAIMQLDARSQVSSHLHSICQNSFSGTSISCHKHFKRPECTTESEQFCLTIKTQKNNKKKCIQCSINSQEK